MHHFALLLGYGAGAINPYLAFDTIRDLLPRGRADRAHRAQGGQELRQGRGQGRPQGDVEDGHLHRRVLHRRADLRGDRPAAGARRRVLHRHRVAHRGHRPRRDRRRRSRARHQHRVPRPARGARAPRAAGRRRVPVAPRGRVPPLQPRHGLQAAARDAQRPLRRLQGVHARSSTTRRSGSRRCAACSSCKTGERAAGADRRGRAGRARSSSGSRPARCATARSRRKRTRTSRSR